MSYRFMPLYKGHCLMHNTLPVNTVKYLEFMRGSVK